MAGLFTIKGKTCSFPSTNPATRVEINTTEPTICVSFDGTTSQSINDDFMVPSGITAPLTVSLFLLFPIATSGTAVFEVSVMAVSGGDPIDLSTTLSYDSVNNSGAISTGGTVYYPVKKTYTLTNIDSIAALDWVKFKIARSPADANDNITSACILVAAIVEDAR
jgi:hypothetical protein